MTNPNHGYPSVAALVMARAQQQLADKYQDSDLATNGRELEQRALAAIKLGQSELEPKPESDKSP